MTDKQKLADEIAALSRRASLAPWVIPRRLAADDRHRGDIVSSCRGFPETPVAKMAGQQDYDERAANTELMCLLRSNVDLIVEALRRPDSLPLAGCTNDLLGAGRG